MRFTVVLVVLCAILMVSMANRANRANKHKRKMMKKGMKDMCSHIVTWGTCVNEKIIQTVSMNMSDPACSHPIVDSQTQTNTMDCVTVITKTLRKGCTKTFTRDFKGCENNGANYTLTVKKSAECGKRNGGGDKVVQQSCSRAVVVNHSKKLKIRANKKGKGKGMMAEKRKFKKMLKQLQKNKKCQYTPGPCDKSINKMTWQMKSGDPNDCKATLDSVCFMGKMKRNRRQKGGKKQG